MSDNFNFKDQNLVYIAENCIKPAEALLNSGFEIPALTLACIGIEWIGGCAEDIPGGAKKRSRKRFEAALNRYFPEKYANRDLDLYRRLRTVSIHNPLQLRSKMILCKPNRHLEFSEDKVCISVKQLLEDMKLTLRSFEE